MQLFFSSQEGRGLYTYPQLGTQKWNLFLQLSAQFILEDVQATAHRGRVATLERSTKQEKCKGPTSLYEQRESFLLLRLNEFFINSLARARSGGANSRIYEQGDFSLNMHGVSSRNTRKLL